MAIKEKVSQDNLFLYEILKNPVLCGEFIANYDKQEWEEEFEYTEYQTEMLCDFNTNVSLSCARAIGKTVVISDLIKWMMINDVYSGEADYIVYTVPNRSHLEPVFTNLIKLFRGNSFLKNFIESKKGINNSTFTITLLNQTKLICRIAGQSNDGRNVVGLHTPVVLLDEAGYYNWYTFQEALPIFNSFTLGARFWVSGVPTGLRENNVLYHADQENSAYTKHRVSALENPRFSDKDKEQALTQYGGEESDDYIHMVLGQHGKPVFALFDRSLFEMESGQIYKLTLDGIKLGNNISSYVNLINTFPGAPNKTDPIFFGIDLGYTEPTAVVILYRTRNGQLKFHGRIRLNKVNYTVQEKIIDLLDSKFKPVLIGIDEGSSGKAVVHTLLEHQDYIHKDYRKRMIPINFSSQTAIGIDENGEEIKEDTKPYAVSVLQSYSNHHKLVYNNTDLEMVVELERMTYTKTPTGKIVYRTLTERGGKRGEDHFTAALLCIALAYHLTEESLDLQRHTKKLLAPRWLVGGYYGR